MVEILIVTHGNLAVEILKSSEIIVGKQHQVTTMGLFQGDCIEDFRDRVAQEIGKLGREDGVLVFVDLYGGSPSNAAVLSLNTEHVKDIEFQCITGVNLPMLLEVFMSRSNADLQTLADLAVQAGRRAIQGLSMMA
jgi:PTS system mannose-specific IIA component